MKKFTPLKKKASIRQTFPFLSLYYLTDYRSFSRDFRGNLGVRNLGSVGIGASSESLRFRTRNGNSTLVVFTEANYQGSFRVFRGETNIADLREFNLENAIVSFVMADRTITSAEINQIRENARVPSGFAEVRRTKRADFASKRGLRK